MSVYFSTRRTASIRNHLFLLALGSLLPVVLFAAGLAVIQARQERQTFERGMHDRVVAITSAVDAELRSTVAALRTLAESQALADGDLQRFHGLALRVTHLDPDWVTVILADADGRQLVNATRPVRRRAAAHCRAWQLRDRAAHSAAGHRQPVVGSERCTAGIRCSRAGAERRSTDLTCSPRWSIRRPSRASCANRVCPRIGSPQWSTVSSSRWLASTRDR